MATKKLLGLAAILEVATGLALLIYPPLIVRLLFGADVSGAAIALSRVAGIALLSLGSACWPGSETTSTKNGALRGMFIYNLLVTVYFFYLGVADELVGILLWWVVAVHAVLSLLLALAWRHDRQHPRG